MKKAIVTGASGFIGRFLVRELVQDGVEVYAVCRSALGQSGFWDHDTLNIIECDLSHIGDLPKIIMDKEIDCIFHLAWQGVSDADAKNCEIQLANIGSSLKLIEVAHEMNISTVVQAGSICEFEVMKEMVTSGEVSGLRNMYKAAKLAAHWMGKSLASNYGIRYFCPVIINAYGEQEKSDRLINCFIRKILCGESPELTSGNQIYDFVHVMDVAHALYLIASKGNRCNDYVIGSGAARPLKDFLTEAGKIVNEMKGGEKVPLGFGRHAGGAISLPAEIFDISKLVDIGFKPQISFREGIERTTHYIMETYVSGGVIDKQFVFRRHFRINIYAYFPVKGRYVA